MTQPIDDPQNSFPTKEIVLGSVGLVKDHFGVFIRAAWLPALLFILGTAWAAAAYPISTEFPDPNDAEAAVEFVFGPGGLFEAVVAQLLTALLIVPAATTWVRLTVLGPPEDGRFPLLSLTIREFSYLMTYVALFMVFMIIALFVAALIGTVLGSLSPVIGIFIGAAAGLLVVSRLLPSLAAAAFGERFGFRSAWRMTKPDTMPLFGAVVSFGMPLMAAQFVLALIAGALLYDLGLFVHGAVVALIQAVAILLSSVFVGRVYAYYKDML